MPYVYSTATASGSYCHYEKVPSNPDNRGAPGHNKLLKKVTINGGANVATKHLVTPRGAVTEVSDEDLEFLMQHAAFKRHMEAGFLSVDKKKVDPDKKALDMTPEDDSAPVTPKDFEKGENSQENAKVYKGKFKGKL